MRIVYICLCGLYIPGWSYQENILSKYQIKAGHQVTIITSNWIYDKKGNYVLYDEEQVEYDHDAKVIRLLISGNKGFKSKMKRFDGLYEAIEKENPELIFLHSPQLLDADVICKYLKKHEYVRLVVDNHCDDRNSATNWFSKNILHKIIWKRSVSMLDNYADIFFGVVPAREKFLSEMYGLNQDRIRLLPFGADDELVEEAKRKKKRDEVRAKYGISADDILLLTGGKIDHNKTETLELMQAIISMDRLDVKLLIFGSISDELKKHFEALAKSKNIIYIGWVKSENIYDYFETCDLILFPGLHSVLWEQAVGAGKACIFRRIEGFQHIDLGGNCQFFNGFTSTAMKKQIEQVVDTESISNMNRIAEKKGRAVFSYRMIARTCIESKS